MTFASRRAVLAAAIALPLAAALAGYVLTNDAEPPEIPTHIRVGESAEATPDAERSESSPTPGVTTTGKRPDPVPRPGTQVVPPPPPVGDDDGGHDGRGHRGGGDDDDGGDDEAEDGDDG